MSYEERINEARFRLQRNVHLPKGQSKAILINDCPYCQEYRNCSRIIKDDGTAIRMLCKIRSNELDAVWLNIRADDRPSVKIGDQFGKLTVISQDKPDDSGRLKWLCLCDCGKHKVIRGDNLLGERTSSCGCEERKRNDLINSTVRRNGTVSNEEKKIAFLAQEIESQIDAPGHVKHNPVSTYVNKTNQSVDHLQVGADEDWIRHEFYLRGQCPECHARTFYNKDGYQQCEGCGLCNSEVTFEGVQEYTIEQIDSMRELFKDLKPQESFEQPPDEQLARFILLPPVSISLPPKPHVYPDRANEDWSYIARAGAEMGSHADLFSINGPKADWWDHKQFPASEVIQWNSFGKEYTLFDSQLIEYVDNLLEKLMQRLKCQIGLTAGRANGAQCSKTHAKQKKNRESAAGSYV